MDIKNEFDYNKTWNVIDSIFYDKEILVKHHIDSFNDFIETLIPQTLKEFSPVKIFYNFDEKIHKYKNKLEIKFEKGYITHAVINENNGNTKIMYPNEARLRNMTYSGNLLSDISIETYELSNDEMVLKNLQETEGVNLGKIPIMVGSKFCSLNNQNASTKVELGECKYDYGGYFIVLGSEKVIIPQEAKCPNKVYIFPTTKTLNKFSKIVEITSITKNNMSYVKPLQVRLYNNDNNLGKVIRVNLKRFKADIPLFIIYRALGIIADKSIIEYIINDLNLEENNVLIKLLEASVEDSKLIKTKEMALKYLIKLCTLKYDYKNNEELTEINKIKYIENILITELLPHVGDHPMKKLYFLSYMVRKLLNCEIGKIEYDDRDSFFNKRVESAGTLMNTLFRSNFTKMIKDMRSAIDKDIKSGRIIDMELNIERKIKQGTIELGMKYGLATGNWNIKGNNQNIRQGIAQVLNRLSYASFLSYLRRINAPIDRSLKDVKPRNLHNSQYGMICPSETPEGQAIGIVKNMALTATITIGSNPEVVLNILEELDIEYIEHIIPSEIQLATFVLLNGDLVGIHRKPEELVKNLKQRKYNGDLNIYTSICWRIQMNEILIYTDSGRLCRPLYLVENNNLLITNEISEKVKNSEFNWDKLIHSNNDEKAIIEYVDIEECDTLMIAMTYDDIKNNKYSNNFYYNYTHCELHPAMMYGALVSNIPFCNHNQAPRNQYQAAMGKQAIGIFATNYNKRIDTMQNILYYPQKPLLSTRPSKYLNFDKMPSGINAIIAIASYTGYNQEDSLMVNESALQRGLFNSSYLRKYESQEKKNQHTLEEEKFCKPERFYPDGSIKTLEIKPASYDKLNPETGIINVGEYVTEKDIIIGKIIPLKSSDGNEQFRDSSTGIKKNESGYIDQVYMNKDSENYSFCKIKIRTERVPVIGDKFASRHGQKGTIGMKYKHEDMPFTKDGIVPDMIVSPHAIPSRMTVGQLLECVLGKASLIKGCESDATAFNKSDANTICDLLQEFGFNRSGTEVLYNGRTGEQIQTQIFIGPTFYQRLKHMVKDKVHARSTGPYNLLTRQPAEGRSRDGGLRIGEMERDCLLSHGMTNFINERLFDCSDKFFIYVCDKCGQIAIANKDKNLFECKFCDNTNYFSKVKIPYSCKLFFHELMSMGIVTQIKTENFIEDVVNK